MAERGPVYIGPDRPIKSVVDKVKRKKKKKSRSRRKRKKQVPVGAGPDDHHKATLKTDSKTDSALMPKRVSQLAPAPAPVGIERRQSLSVAASRRQHFQGPAPSLRRKASHVPILTADFSVEQRYKLSTEELGRGLQSVVFRATTISSKVEVAVKRIQKNRLPYLTEDDKEEIRREVAILKQLNHPIIINLLDVYETMTEVLLVQELAPGAELFSVILDREVLKEANARVVFSQLVDSLSYVHSKGLIHADVKPQNILVDVDDEGGWRVKLIDFGFAVPLGTTITHGSPGYAAPEILMNSESTGPAVDMWACGVTLFIMLGGYPPFFSDDESETFQKVLTADYDIDDECWEDVSTSAKELVAQLIVVDPESRLTSHLCKEHEWIVAEE